ITVSGAQWQDDCCHYSDFRLGPAEIVWSKGATPDPIQDPSHAIDYGVAARLDLAGTEEPDAYEIIPMPGIAVFSQAVTVRVDHGYVGTLAGRNVTFDVGVVRTETPG